MKAKRLLILAAVLFLLGFVSVCSGWHGNAGVNVAYPIAGTSVQFCGSASGGFALAGILGMFFGIVVLLVALIRMAVSRAPS